MNKILVLIELTLVSFALFLSSFLPFSTSSTPISDSDQVLGRYNRGPQIYISNYGDSASWVSGGIVSLSSISEPVVEIGGYGMAGEMETKLYPATMEMVLDYLLHDKDGKRIGKNPDFTNLEPIVTDRRNLTGSTNSNYSVNIPLPLKPVGVWYLTVKIGGTKADAFIVRSNLGAVNKEGANQFIFWVTDFTTKRSVNSAMVTGYNLEQTRKLVFDKSVDSQGIATANLDVGVDVAIVKKDDDVAILPINLRYLNAGWSGYREFDPKSQKASKYFLFTDRPIYQPGDKVYFKAVLRDDDDARYSVPTGLADVRVYNGYFYTGSEQKPFFQKILNISSEGTIDGEISLPKDAKTGSYTVRIENPNQDSWSSMTAYFQVEFYQKPEYSIKSSFSTTELIAKDKLTATIDGRYFSGQPLAGQKVQYRVDAASFYEFSYLADYQSYLSYFDNSYRYGSWYQDKEVAQGVAELDENGQAIIDVSSSMDFNAGRSQVFTLEATLEDGSSAPAISRSSTIVHAGEFGIYRDDYSYGGDVNTVFNLPLSLVAYKGHSVQSKELTAKIRRESWKYTLTDPNTKQYSYSKETEDLPIITAKTDANGKARLGFTPTKVGLYTIIVNANDSRGNSVSKEFSVYISDNYQPFYSQSENQSLTISSDQQKYNPKDQMLFNIFSTESNRDVLLTIERGRVDRFYVVPLNGNTASINVPVSSSDIPNIFASVAAFSKGELDRNSIELPISANSKKLVVKIDPVSKKYGPSDNVAVDILTTDLFGNPVSADLAFWAVDKAIFELSSNNLGDIFDTFWQERYNNTSTSHSLEGITVNAAEMGGCFTGDTQILMADGSKKEIADIRKGDLVKTFDSRNNFVEGKVSAVMSASDSGVLIINSDLKTTVDHLIKTSRGWLEASQIQVGDKLFSQDGHWVDVSSIEWQSGNFAVYNLTVEKYQTFIANGYLVHNNKGESDRSVFKDTAYWNPSVKTDGLGKVRVNFKLPDNLTTWTLAAVANTTDTKVGQNTAEIVVSKDVIVRPILPNILRVGDKINLNSLVQNYTGQKKSFSVSLVGDSTLLSITPKDERIFDIGNLGMVESSWSVNPLTAKDSAALTFQATSVDNKDLSDKITVKIPIVDFGFWDKSVQTGSGNKTYPIKFFVDSSDKTKIRLDLSPTIVGTLPTAMNYLIGYPYGCVEQTTSRFVPAIIAMANPTMFKAALADKDLAKITNKGVVRLRDLQNSDGGWGWTASGQSNAFITAYVLEYLWQARILGVEVDGNIFESAKNYVNSVIISDDIPTKVSKFYAQTIIGEKKLNTVPSIQAMPNDILALNVLSWIKSGNNNPKTNGLEILTSRAKQQGNTAYWQEGSSTNFGSNDASTALAVRALLASNTNTDLATKAIMYLSASRKSDYWSNSFATSQVIRAITDFSKVTKESDPVYTYQILLDGKALASGKVDSSQATIKTVEIPFAKISKSGSVLEIRKNGTGEIYSTFITDQYRTDKSAAAKNAGLKVSKEYINDRGDLYSLAVGDSVTVRITVEGINNSNYLVIDDELPSGLVPINEHLKNTSYGGQSFDYTPKEYTQNGVVIYSYYNSSNIHTYTYRARVVSEGEFITPGATAMLMYSPEVNGRSEVQKIITTSTREVVPGKIAKSKGVAIFANNYFALAIIVVLLFVMIVLVALFLRKKRHEMVISNSSGTDKS